MRQCSRPEVDQKEYENDLISEQQITLSKARVEQRKKVLEINRACLETYRTETMPAQLAETDATVRKAESLYRLKKNQVESLHVRAGAAGVLAQVKDKIEPGQSVSPGTIVAKITNPQEAQGPVEGPRGPGPGPAPQPAGGGGHAPWDRHGKGLAGSIRL